MNRIDCDRNLDKLKSYNHLTKDAYKHTAKVLEYLLYELDCIRDRANEPPSIYGSYVESEVEVDEVEVDEVEIKIDEPPVFNKKAVPMVLAYTNIDNDVNDVNIDNDVNNIDTNIDINKHVLPTIDIVGEEDKTHKHLEAVKRVKLHLKELSKKK